MQPESLAHAHDASKGLFRHSLLCDFHIKVPERLLLECLGPWLLSHNMKCQTIMLYTQRTLSKEHPPCFDNYPFSRTGSVWFSGEKSKGDGEKDKHLHLSGEVALSYDKMP